MRLFVKAAISLFALSAFSFAASAQEKIEITPELIAAANKEGSLTLQYSSPLLQMQGNAEAFNKVYPDIRVNLERKSGSAGAYALLQELAAGVSRVDLFQGSDWAVNKELADKGAFASVTFSNVDDFNEFAPDLTPQLYSPGVHRTVISYNPAQVTPEEAEKLKSWEGILDPAFKGRISIVEPTFGVTLAPLTYIMSQPQLGEDFLRKLKAQEPLIFVNTAQAREAVLSGQRPISWGAQWEAVILTDIEKGAPIRFVYPDPSPEWGSAGWAIMSNAPHPAAAKLFLAWKMSQEGGVIEQESHSNTKSGLKTLDDTRKSIELVNQQDWFAEPVEVWHPSHEQLITNGTKYQEIWTSIMKGR